MRFVEYLKEILLYRGPNERVHKYEIVENIDLGNKMKVNPTYFNSKILGPLRDSDVLIASNREGYKLPSCKKDIIDFFEMFFANIDPMIKRIKACHDSIRLATGNKLDLLENDKFHYLKKVFED